MAITPKNAGKNTTYIIGHYQRITESGITLMDVRQSAISAIAQYRPYYADLYQAVKEADHFYYTRRLGTAVRAAALATRDALQEHYSDLLRAREALMQHFDICGSCFGQGQEAGWTCPACAGSTHEPSTEARYYCAWCRNLFAPTPDTIQTYCVNCQKHAPSAKAAGLPEMEWRKIAVHNVGSYQDGHPLSHYSHLFCAQYECSACGGRGHFFSFVDDQHRPLPEGQSRQVQCGYCYPAEKPAEVVAFEEATSRQAHELALEVEAERESTEPSTKPTKPAKEKHNRFARGTGRYTCADCGKATRDTGNGEAEVGLCLKCYDEAGLENEHSDYGHPQPVAGCPTCRYESEHPQPSTEPQEERGSEMGSISVAYQGSNIRICGPQAVYVGTPANVPTGDHEYAYNGWQYDWLGVVPAGQSYRVVMLASGEVLGTFNTDLEAAAFIYNTLQAGLVSTVYTEPQPPATVPAEPVDPSPDVLFNLRAIEAKSNARLDQLEAKLDHVLGLLAVLIPAVQAAKVTIGPKPTDAQATARQAVERAVEAAQADPTEPCKALGCKNGMIALGQKCPACKGTGRVQKAEPVPADYQYMTPEGHYICDMCGTEYKKNHPLHRGLCAECLKAAEMLEGYVVGDEAGEWVKADPEALPMVADVKKPQLMPGTAEHFLGWLEDDSKLGRSYVEWAVWVLGNRQTEEELSAGGTLYENGVGFNGADSGFGTSLLQWLQSRRATQPHLTPGQINSARKLVKKYVATQLMPNFDAWGGPHTESPFRRGDKVEVTTWQDASPHTIEDHDWLYLYFNDGAPPARWFDCRLVALKGAQTEEEADGLEEVVL